jgi:tetratricopeptide (TPR) repeat protein
MLDRLEEILNTLRKSVEKRCNNAKIWFMISQLESKMGDQESSDEALTYALYADPTHRGALLEEARRYVRDGFWWSAAEAYEHYLELYPSDRPALKELKNINFHRFNGMEDEGLGEVIG